MRNIRLQFALITIGLSLTGQVIAYVGPSHNQNGDNHAKSSSAGCVPATASTELELNNVRALIHTGGDMWWDLQGNPKYEVPKGSGKHSLFAGAIWVGGTDVNGQLRLYAQKYRTDGNENWPGPLKATGSERSSVTADVCAKYDRHFAVTRNEVTQFRSWFNAKQANNTDLLNSQFADYTIPQILYDWPAINTDPDYDYYLAPFWDENGDGYYNPDDGDYPFFDLDKILPCGTTRALRKPRLFGDETLWWVYNDKGNVHTEMNGAAIGMEIRAQAFAFATNDELNNMTFGNYALINRSTYTLQDTYFGVWTDADLGDHSDDFVGCDVQRGLGYLYNGDEMDGDGNGKTYGDQPPAIGVDFFEGPYQDADGSDWGETGISGGCDESVNGLNFGDGVIDNERWGMRRYLYFNNSTGVMGDPNTAVETYNYLRGYWRDGTRMTYGGTGHSSSSTDADFMFPGRPTTDPCGWGTGGIPQSDWSEESENNTPADRRFVQSAGPFTLEPGAINDITVGMVWARATTGGAWASVDEVRQADDKAQRLFEVCFKLIDGPNAPELEIIELNQQLIFHIYNVRGSNNYTNVPEDYEEYDPFIVCPDGEGTCDTIYRFEGYQVFQMADESCSVTDITNPDKAKLVFQCDIKNDVSRLINYELDSDLGVVVPEEKVNGNDEGIKHTFTLTDDQFATGDKRLVNHKTYYYVAIAYAYNNYESYIPDDPMSLDGQKKPYLASRNSANGSIEVYSAIPHIPSPRENGTILNSEYGDGPKITQIEGMGNGNNYLELTQSTVDEIMSGSPWKSDEVEYENGAGPVAIKIIDPLNVPAYDFELKFMPDSVSEVSTRITKAKWMVYSTSGTNDTIYSDQWINVDNEQIIADWGISINIFQTDWPGGGNNPNQNGYVGSEYAYNDPSLAWLQFIPDGESCDMQNWIRAGSVTDPNNPGCDDYVSIDDDEYFEKVIEGQFAPYRLASQDYLSTSNQYYGNGVAYHYGRSLIKWYNQRLASVDLVITSDKSKWTRCAVVEMCENDLNGGASYSPGLSEGGQWKFGLRKHASIDKNGSTTNTGDSLNENSSNYISATGMGWFPGYAIDVETGERLNIVYSEDSRYPGENGQDMMWNPTGNYASDLYYTTGGSSGDLFLGGKHFVYVFGHNKKPGDTDYMPAYDYGKTIHDGLVNSTDVNDLSKREIWKNAMWVTLPMLAYGIEQENPTDPYYFIRTDVKFSLRTANPYRRAKDDWAKTNPVNDNLPYYKFTLKDVAPVTNDNETAEESLDLIRVVPNPYYGYCSYEKSQLENLVKITNLPQKCTISIFTVNGTLIRRFKKDSELSYQDWDLTNEYGIPIASGLYIIHIDAPGIGEKVVKWFGSLRPIDLSNF